ncbi:MAG TPA: hypothetical protein VM600_01160, partial [Actinomycetota bacterium]|nr:hypothetical protein [Actinomycetota bacterium]
KKSTTAGGGDGSKYCQLARALEDDADQLEDIDFTDVAKLGDEFRRIINQIEPQLDAYVAASPSGIKADAQVLAQSFRELKRILESFDYDFSRAQDPKVAAELQKLGTLFNDKDIEAATDRIETYNKDECGIEPDPEPSQP